jgi:hypothetical protein
MDDKRLKELIQSADLPPNADDDDAAGFAVRIPSLHRRRRTRTLAVGLCVAIFGCGIAVFAIHHARSGVILPSPLVGEGMRRAQPSGPARRELVEPGARGKQDQVAIDRPSPKVTPAETKPSLAELRAEIDLRQRVVDALLQSERADRLERQEHELAARVQLAGQRDVQIAPLAASYLVSGDEKRQIGLPLASAKADYIRVVELFPGTVWAERAKVRLAALER